MPKHTWFIEFLMESSLLPSSDMPAAGEKVEGQRLVLLLDVVVV